MMFFLRYFQEAARLYCKFKFKKNRDGEETFKKNNEMLHSPLVIFLFWLRGEKSRHMATLRVIKRF